MRRLVSGLIWTALAIAVPGVILAFEWTDGPAPGHDTSACRSCRTGTPYRGRSLPFEIDGRNVRPGLPDHSAGRPD